MVIVRYHSECLLCVQLALTIVRYHSECLLSVQLALVIVRYHSECLLSVQLALIIVRYHSEYLLSVQLALIIVRYHSEHLLSVQLALIIVRYHFLYNRIFIPPIRLHCYYYQKSKIQWSYTMLVEFYQLILFLVMFFTLFNFKNVLHFSLQLKSPKTHKLPRLFSSKKPSYHLDRL